MITKRLITSAVVAIAAASTLVGCSTESTLVAETPQVTQKSSEAKPRTAKAEEKKDAACLEVKKPMLQAIADGSNDYKMTPIKGSAIKAGKYYYIAMEYKTETKSGDLIAENDVALWASTAIDGSGGIQSIDNMAAEFTDWPKNVWGLSLSDDQAIQAKKCIK